jgi:glycosyltransferase involved in cell wall biosynthesis
MTPSTRSEGLVIIPALNEQAALGDVLDSLAALESSLDAPIDVLVVDDGSTDDTRAVARAHGAAVAPLPYNLGIGGALRTGFTYAVRHDYQWAVQFDADGQHDSEAVATLTSALADGADLVIGSRFTDSTDYQVSAARGSAMSLLRLLVRILTGRRFTDTSSGFRGFSRPMLEFFARNYPVEYMESVESLVLAVGAGFDVREVAVQMSSRASGVASTRRLRLVYHFLRVLVVMMVSKGALRDQHKQPVETGATS